MRGQDCVLPKGEQHRHQPVLYLLVLLVQCHADDTVRQVSGLLSSSATWRCYVDWLVVFIVAMSVCRCVSVAMSQCCDVSVWQCVSVAMCECCNV